MVYQGQVKNGVVVFESAAPPDGTVVRVEALPQEAVAAPPDGSPSKADVKALWDGLMELAGTAKGLPADLAERHDHYRRERQKR
jgi:hypothetical protein